MTNRQKFVAWLLMFTICVLILVLIRTVNELNDQEERIRVIVNEELVGAEIKLDETERHLRALLSVTMSVAYGLDKAAAIILIDKAYKINDNSFVGIGRTKELIDSLLSVGWEDSIVG